MAFRFKFDEAPVREVRRIADEQASRIIERLGSKAGDETTVHESRKSLKRLKALFKLVRSGLSKQTYAREYRTVRDVGRALSGVRDFEVMPLTLASLSTADTAIDQATVEQVRSAIDRAHGKLAGTEQRSEALAKAAQQISLARKRYARLALDGEGMEILANGAARGLRELRRQHDAAVASGADEDYHDWRKSAQLHWRHLRLLSEIWPAFVTARLTATKCLADTLGHDHDLSVLASFVKALPKSRLKAARRKAVLDAVLNRQHALRDEALAYAGLLVVDEPGSFAERLRAMHAARLRIAKLQSPLCNLFAEPSSN